MNKCYSELIQLQSFIERFNYLKLDGIVGLDTFGHDRYINQILYKSIDWRSFRREIIIRDSGNDLACEGFEIFGTIIVHHINPLNVQDILNRSSKIFDPENAISTRLSTHNAIHYGNEDSLILCPVERTKNDTIPWRR